MATLFLTHSIYHILYSLSIVYKSKDEHPKYIVLASRNNEESNEILNNILGLEEEWTKQIKIINIPDLDISQNSKYSQDSLNVINEIKKIAIDELIIFGEHNLLAIHLGQYFYRKKTKIALAQDGMLTYAKINKMAIRYCTLMTVDFYKYCKRNKFSYSPIFISMKYGSSYFISKFYVSNKDKFKNNYQKVVSEIKVSSEVLQIYNKSITHKTELDYEKETIFYASSLLKWNEKQIEIESKIIQKVKDKNPNCQLIVKLHPRTSADVLNYYKNHIDCVLIVDKIPAEVYLVNFKKCILLSAYSGVALFEGDKKVYFKKYWLYPLYGKSLNVLSYTNLIRPDDNIILLSKWEELESIKFS